MTATLERDLRPTISGHIDPLFEILLERVPMDTKHYDRIQGLEQACIDAPGWSNMVGGSATLPLPVTLSSALYTLQRYAVDNGIVTQDELAELYSEPVAA